MNAATTALNALMGNDRELYDTCYATAMRYVADARKRLGITDEAHLDAIHRTADDFKMAVQGQLASIPGKYVLVLALANVGIGEVDWDELADTFVGAAEERVTSE